jgi:hypothetical protein
VNLSGTRGRAALALVPTIPVGGTIEVRVGAFAHEAPKMIDIVVVNPPVEADRGHIDLAEY